MSNQGVGRVTHSLEALGEIPSSLFPDAGGSSGSLVCSCITSISVSVFPFSLLPLLRTLVAFGGNLDNPG